MPTPLWLLPKDWNPNIQEGRNARRDGLPMAHRYGDSTAGREWEQGWRAEDAISPVKLTPPPETRREVQSHNPVTSPTAVAEKAIKVSGVLSGRRGRPPATGKFATREELVAVVLGRRTEEAKKLASDVGVSVPTILKIIEQG